MLYEKSQSICSDRLLSQGTDYGHLMLNLNLCFDSSSHCHSSYRLADSKSCVKQQAYFTSCFNPKFDSLFSMWVTIYWSQGPLQVFMHCHRLPLFDKNWSFSRLRVIRLCHSSLKSTWESTWACVRKFCQPSKRFTLVWVTAYSSLVSRLAF